MKINSLKIENFKAIENLEIVANGANVTISGQNGTGKTTVADAYFWIFTGKFADGSIGEVNQYDADGKLIRDGKIHAVEIELDDKTTIRRESVNTFDKVGNFKSTTQNFFVDGVELKQKDFDAEILKITGGAALNPFGFCQMAWKERRNILMKMCPIDNAAVIATNEIFQQLNLKNFAPDAFITAKKSEIKKIAEQLQGVPARIDELSHKKFVIEGDEETLKAEVDRTKAELKAAADKVAQTQKLLAERDKQKNELFRVQSKIGKLESELELLDIKIKQAEKNLEEMREDYIKIATSKGGTCPTCGQAMPVEKFNETKNKKIAEISTQGKQLKIEYGKLVEEISTKEKEVENFKHQAEKIQAQIDAAEKSATMNELNTAIAKRDKIISESTQATNNLARFLQNRDDAEKTKQRIEELKKLESELNQRKADCERQIDLAEKFIRAKVKLIEDTVNSKFEFVKFKMFETLINGSVKEICEPMIDGVPYNSGLNRGAKFKAALDILRTLQKFFGVELPIFIDDAESYTSNSLVKIPNQLFLMKAVEGQEVLKIEVEKKPEGNFKLDFEEAKVA